MEQRRPSFDRPTLAVLEAHVGGFTPRTVRLAHEALTRARKIEGRELQPEGAGPTCRRASALPQYVGHNDGQPYSRL